MTDVAVVIREDTGLIQEREGDGLDQIAHVFCDSCKTVRPIPNAYVIDEQHGRGHRFDGADFDPDCVADDRYHVVVYFFINKKGQRCAKFHYYPKSRGSARSPNDPFYLTVIEGKKLLVTIGKAKTIAP